MLQTAVVNRILSAEVAEVSLLRQTECGLSCTSCQGCPQRSGDALIVQADNSLGANVGDVVTVQANHTSAIWVAALVWLLPCIGLILGCLAADALALTQGISVLCTFFGLVLGFLPAGFVNRALRRRNVPEFTIVSLRR